LVKELALPQQGPRIKHENKHMKYRPQKIRHPPVHGQEEVCCTLSERSVLMVAGTPFPCYGLAKR
jgi:hypothetical protein